MSEVRPRCKKRIYRSGFSSSPCSHPAGNDGFCFMHTPVRIAERRRKVMDKVAAEIAADTAKRFDRARRIERLWEISTAEGRDLMVQLGLKQETSK